MKKLAISIACIIERALVTLLALQVAMAAAAQDVPVYDYQVVRTFPHDPDAFTQGLLYRDGYLYESTGLRGQSTIRKVELATGKVVQTADFPAGIFGEGIVDWGDQLIGLSWKRQTGFVWDIGAFTLNRKFGYPGEGWGLTRNTSHLIMSDGTPSLRFLDPLTLKEDHRITVTANGRPLKDLNELEWVNGEIFANIWQSDVIVRINPKSGDVVGIIDMRGLLASAGPITGAPDVLNGIALGPEGQLYVTGKKWHKLFEIQLTRRQP